MGQAANGSGQFHNLFEGNILMLLRGQGLGLYPIKQFAYGK